MYIPHKFVLLLFSRVQAPKSGAQKIAEGICCTEDDVIRLVGQLLNAISENELCEKIAYWLDKVTMKPSNIAVVACVTE
jgi:hypothetical protein